MTPSATQIADAAPAEQELGALRAAVRALAAGGPLETSSLDKETARALAEIARAATGAESAQAALDAASLALLADLREAIADEALTVVYQPKLNLRTGRIDAVEALLRWTHPVRGAVPPDAFIGLAEASGDIDPITERVLRLVVRDQAAMGEEGERPAVYVNLSGVLLADDAFCRRARALCAEAPGRIGMEITETAVIRHPEAALANLRAFVDAGVGVAIDDYGTGLSSLAYLKTLPAGELKIDKAFVMGLTSSHRDPLIVRSTIDLAHALEMQVTAEGVDDPTALALLQVMGCDRVQGFHISRPVPLAELVPLLAEPDSMGRLTQRPGGLLRLAR